MVKVSAAIVAKRRYTAERKKRIRLGTWRGLVDATAARAHVQEMMTVWQVSHEAIALAAQVNPNTIRHLVEGAPHRQLPPPAHITADVADIILTVTVDDLPGTKRINPIGATRRLRGIALKGWPLSEFVNRGAGTPYPLKVLRGGSSDKVTVDLARRIRDVTDELSDLDPLDYLPERHVKGVLTRSAGKGWFPLAAWADAIDDPRVRPWEVVRCAHPDCGRGSHDERLLCKAHLRTLKDRGTLEGLRTTRNGAALIEDAEFVIATDRLVRHDDGVNMDLVAERLEVKPDALERALLRHKAATLAVVESTPLAESA